MQAGKDLLEALNRHTHELEPEVACDCEPGQLMGTEEPEVACDCEPGLHSSDTAMPLCRYTPIPLFLYGCMAVYACVPSYLPVYVHTCSPLFIYTSVPVCLYACICMLMCPYASMPQYLHACMPVCVYALSL